MSDFYTIKSKHKWQEQQTQTPHTEWDCTFDNKFGWFLTINLATNDKESPNGLCIMAAWNLLCPAHQTDHWTEEDVLLVLGDTWRDETHQVYWAQRPCQEHHSFCRETARNMPSVRLQCARGMWHHVQIKEGQREEMLVTQKNRRGQRVKGMIVQL